MNKSLFQIIWKLGLVALFYGVYVFSANALSIDDPINGENTNREAVVVTNEYPASATVYISIMDDEGKSYRCSGAMVGPNHVLSAAHCFSEVKHVSNVYPAYDHSNKLAPFGACKAQEITYLPEAKSGNYSLETVWADYALITLTDCSMSQNIGEFTGWFGLTDELVRLDNVRMLGYGPGYTLYVGDGVTGLLDTYVSANFMATYESESGDSGAPVYRNDTGCGNCIVGVHSGQDGSYAHGARMVNGGTLKYNSIFQLLDWGAEEFAQAQIKDMQAMLPGSTLLQYPRDENPQVQLTPTLQWLKGSAAETYNVYFGQNVNLTEEDLQVANTSERTFATGQLRPGETYYWRVDGINSFGVQTSQIVFSFTTVDDI
ncbi:trypsin-like serine protease [uncultured Shewanella sp.]|uniref:trypsin-like serine peptidase n=1 Tax=uncultured Shewanella sp. TaxID=173975 RepID=UPI00261ED296|nr:trypsin-like serine protease [uncultured Shewanella sp.]